MHSLETPATQDTGRPNEQKINPTQHKTETKRMNNTDPSTKKTKRKQTHILDKQFLFLITLIKTRINPENKTLHSIEDIDLFLFLLVTELLFLILKCLHIRHSFTLKLPLVDLRDCPIKMTGLGFGYLLLLNLKFYVSYFVDNYFFFRSQYCLSFVVLQVIVLSVLRCSLGHSIVCPSLFFRSQYWSVLRCSLGHSIVCPSLFFRSQYCLSFQSLLLITPLVSSNTSFSNLSAIF